MPAPRAGRGDKAKTQEALVALVLERRSQGESVPAIAASLGLGTSAVSSLLSRALVERASLVDSDLAQIRQLELDRVDRWARVQERRHDKHGDPKAAEMLLRLQARRLALHGVRLDLAEPEAGRGGRAGIVGGGAGETGSLPPTITGALQLARKASPAGRAAKPRPVCYSLRIASHVKDRARAARILADSPP